MHVTICCSRGGGVRVGFHYSLLRAVITEMTPTIIGWGLSITSLNITKGVHVLRGHVIATVAMWSVCVCVYVNGAHCIPMVFA